MEPLSTPVHVNRPVNIKYLEQLAMSPYINNQNVSHTNNGMSEFQKRLTISVSLPTLNTYMYMYSQKKKTRTKQRNFLIILIF